MKNSPIQICSCFLFLLLPSNALLSQVLLNVNGDGKLSGNLQVNKQVLFGHNSTGGGTKLLWMPTLGAFRAGRLSSSSSNNWDPQNVGINSFATGQDPKATGDYSFVGGGRYNTTGGIVSFVGGGDRNSASGFGSFIGGGSSNTASGGSSAIGGGYSQTASGDYSFVGGGIINSATGESSFVGGGVLNSAVGENTFIGGGLYNEATGLYSWIGGGYSNIATGELSFIGGGESNIARSFGETVFGTFNL
ncbi:MAG: hypothetical protein KDD15_32855, partial [Lewinella sp.]|nr:hypothetical protein [Lewinella sp.]